MNDKTRIVIEVPEEVFGAVLEAVRCIDEPLRRFAAVRCLELSNLVRSQFGDRLRWRMSLTAFPACEQLGATFQLNWKSFHYISTISRIVSAH
jgi:hypothetical protein